MDEKGRQGKIEDIVTELRYGCHAGDTYEYLHSLADRIEAAHAAGVIKAMDELMHG